MYVSVNKEFTIFDNCLCLISRLCQWKDLRRPVTENGPHCVASNLLPARQGLSGPGISYIYRLMQSTSRISQFGNKLFDPDSLPYSLVSNNVKSNIHRSLILPVLCGGELWSFRDISYIANDKAGLEEQENVSVMGGEDMQLPKRRLCRRDEITCRLLHKTDHVRHKVCGVR